MTNPVQPTESERVRAAAKRASRHLEKLSEREQLRVLDVLVGNSMTVNYNSVTGFATWNRSGTIAIILI